MFFSLIQRDITFNINQVAAYHLNDIAEHMRNNDLISLPFKEKFETSSSYKPYRYIRDLFVNLSNHYGEDIFPMLSPYFPLTHQYPNITERIRLLNYDMLSDFHDVSSGDEYIKDYFNNCDEFMVITNE